MFSGDSAPYSLSTVLSSPLPSHAWEVVLAAFNVTISSLKITPNAPTPSLWILRSPLPTEIYFLKLFFFFWLASLPFSEVAGGLLPRLSSHLKCQQIRPGTVAHACNHNTLGG